MAYLKFGLFSSLLLLFVVCLAPSSVEASCDETAPGIIKVTLGRNNPVDEGGVANDQCSSIPDEYLVTFNKMAICKNDPLAGAALFGSPNYRSCQFMYNGADNNIIIRHPNFTPLNVPPFNIAAGSYGFLVAVISNKLGMKNTITTSEPIAGLGGATGTTCWTSGGTSSFFNESVITPHGTTTGDAKSIECGPASAAAPVFNFEVMTHFGGPNDSCALDFAGNANFANGGFSETMFDGGGVTNVRVLTGNEAFATTCASASKMIWVIKQNVPYVVGPTSRFSLQFKLTDSVSIDFNRNDDSIVKMGNDPVQAILTVID
jgi:hypothetical protein